MMKKVLILSVVILLSIGLNAQNTSSDTVAISLIMPLTKTDFIAKVMDYDKNPENGFIKDVNRVSSFFILKAVLNVKLLLLFWKNLRLSFKVKLISIKSILKRKKN